MIVQIYGITTVEDAEIVNELGPDNVGIVLDEGIDTWDSVDEATLRLIRHELSRPAVVGLSLSTDLEPHPPNRRDRRARCAASGSRDRRPRA